MQVQVWRGPGGREETGWEEDPPREFDKNGGGGAGTGGVDWTWVRAHHGITSSSGPKNWVRQLRVLLSAAGCCCRAAQRMYVCM